MTGRRGDWQQIGEPLGSGGQSNVYLVRNLSRQLERSKCLEEIRVALDGDKRAQLALAITSFARPDQTSELGALKLYNIKPKGSGIPQPPGTEEFEAIERLRNEIAALQRGLQGLPKLLDQNEDERWIVTEYFPELTLANHPNKYKGQVLRSLIAFRSIVHTVAELHRNDLIHRDIKPANVFIRNDDDLVLGDFGIVYDPETTPRITGTRERVGPRDYMPPWANLGARLQDVRSNVDVYMLGKLLWSMVDGHSVLPREYHRHPEYEFDLTRTFPNDPHMHLVNAILDKCIVERSEQCLPNGQELLMWVDDALNVVKRGGQLLREGVPIPCKICGKGTYQDLSLHGNERGSDLSMRFWFGGSDVGTVGVHARACGDCGHLAIFKR